MNDTRAANARRSGGPARLTLLLFLAAIVVPLGLVAVAGYTNYRHAEDEAFLRARKTADALAEHALAALRSHEQLIDVVHSHIDRMQWSDIIRSPTLGPMLRTLERGHEGTRIMLLDRDGEQEISSKGTVRAITALERSALQSIKDRDELVISVPMDPVSEEPRIRLAKHRLNHYGAFEGLTELWLNARYFESIYANLLETPHDYVALVRADGVILAHVPQFASSKALSARSRFIQAIAQQPIQGQFVAPARLGDGRERIFAYKRVAGYPVYINFALSKSYVWTEWRSRMAPYLLVCLGATALLLIAAFFSYRRAQNEQAASERWARESRLRMDAEEENRAKDDFIAVLAHELRSPLASVTLSGEILERLGGHNQLARSSVDIINRQVHQLRRLVDDLLDLARITHGKLELRCEPLDLLALVRQIDFHSLNNSGRPVAVQACGEPVWVNADAARVQQMVCNLVQNAIKYGGNNVRVSVAAAGDRAQVSVADDGQGIEAGLLPILCEPFVQGKQSIDRPQGGLGLGLAVVRQLALSHGGHLSAHSEGPGKGAIFTIALPRIASPATPARQEAPEALEVTKSRVLVVEDQDDAREALRSLLQLQGQEVLAAANAEDALAAFETFGPDIALVDIGLPGMDGF